MVWSVVLIPWSSLSQSKPSSSELLLEESLSADWLSGSCADSKLVSGVLLFDSTSLVEGARNLEMVGVLVPAGTTILSRQCSRGILT